MPPEGGAGCGADHGKRGALNPRTDTTLSAVEDFLLLFAAYVEEDDQLVSVLLASPRHDPSTLLLAVAGVAGTILQLWAESEGRPPPECLRALLRAYNALDGGS